LMEAVGLDEVSALQIVQYLSAGNAALGTLPTLDTVVFERFFDESGGMQLIIHSPFGSRVNRAWGLSLRKRFCRTFNFELQAAATEDHIVLSLTHAHSFELAEAARYLNSNSVRHVLIQALCAAPMFEVRWRWDAGIALALPRFRGDSTTLHFACRVAVQTAMNARRRAGYRTRHTPSAEPSEIAEMALDDQSPADLFAAEQRREGLRQLLCELPDEQAEVLALHAVLGYTIEETAASTQVPVNTVRSRLRTALSKLRARIQADGALLETIRGGA